MGKIATNPQNLEEKAISKGVRNSATSEGLEDGKPRGNQAAEKRRMPFVCSDGLMTELVIQ